MWDHFSPLHGIICDTPGTVHSYVWSVVGKIAIKVLAEFEDVFEMI